MNVDRLREALADTQDITKARDICRSWLRTESEPRLVKHYRALLLSVIDGDAIRRNAVRNLIETIEAAADDERIYTAASIPTLLEVVPRLFPD